jgi:O-antigen chain-terminating methyltransferase
VNRLTELRGEADARRGVAADGWRGRLVEPLARSQRAFNDVALKVVDALSERVDAVLARVADVERRHRELDERLLRLERRGADAPRTVAAQPRQDALPDYFGFETRFRAPAAEVRERQRPYVELLAGYAPVLDLGCGRGELLALLRDAGIEASGVDADADMVAFARGEGLAVEQADALAHLGARGDGSLGALTALQLVEHLPPAALVRLLDLAAAKLRPGGVLLLETINPASPRALVNYFADLTHAQPLVPATLELLVREAGFSEVEVRYVNEPGARLADVELPEGEQFDAPRAALAANTRLLNETLFPPLDYAVVARRA